MVTKCCIVCENNFEALGNKKTCSSLCGMKLKKLVKKIYNQKLEVKEKAKRYCQRGYVKEKAKKYKEMPKVKQRIKKYKQTKKYREKIRIYKQREEVKQKNRDYSKKPETRIRTTKYQNNRYRVDPHYRIKIKLRAHLGIALRRYTRTGKAHKSLKYGIDYEKIINHLKPFPKNQYLYHIDHIKPLVLFNLEDPEQVKQAFAPENHQWLLAEDNLKKSSKLIL